MKRTRENLLKRLLERRLVSAKGTVYFEFAVMMPIVMTVIFFAADFMRVLYCEQQLEIASRALCDVQCHMTPGDPVNDKIIPASRSKAPVRQYLFNVLVKEGLGRTDREPAINAVYCRAKVDRIKTVFSGVFDPIIQFFKGDPGSKYIDNPFVKLIGKFLGKATDFLTFRTDKYFTELLDRDRCVKASVSVSILPMVPNGYWTFFGRKHSGGEGKTGSILIVPFQLRLSGKVAEYNRSVVPGYRDRYYCTMPLMDTTPMSPATYVKMMKKKFKKFL